MKESEGKCEGKGNVKGSVSKQGFIEASAKVQSLEQVTAVRVGIIDTGIISSTSAYCYSSVRECACECFRLRLVSLDEQVVVVSSRVHEIDRLLLLFLVFRFVTQTVKHVRDVPASLPSGLLLGPVHRDGLFQHI